MTTDFDTLRAANPYTNQSYNKSGWQKFLSALGFRTEADAWKENMAVQAAEYDASIAQKEFDTQYESAPEQVARMKQAGLNPDLDPSSVSPGDAGAMGQDMSTPMQSTGDEQAIMQAVGFITRAVETAFGIAGQIGQLKSLGIANTAGEIDINEKLYKFSKWVFEETRDSFSADYSDEENFNRAFRQHDIIARQLHLPKRFRNQFRQNLSSFYDSLNQDADFWSKKRSSNDDKLAVARQMESKFFSDGSLKGMRIVNNGLVRLSDALAEAALHSDIAQAEASGSKAGYESDYYSELDGAAVARAQNAEAGVKERYSNSLDADALAGADVAEASMRKQTADITKTINSELYKIVHNLKREADRGDILSESLLFGFALARSSSAGAIGSFASKLLSVGLKAL